MRIPIGGADSTFLYIGDHFPEMDFLATLKDTDFIDTDLVAETGFNSSPKPKGVLIHVKKPIEPHQKNQINYAG
jgi:hypothetical protein